MTRLETSSPGATGCASDIVLNFQQDAALARPTSIVRQQGDRATRQAAEPSYDAYGNLVGVTLRTVSDGTRTVSSPYDNEGYFPISTTNAASHQTLLRYDPRLGVLEVERDPNGIDTRHTYDGFGRPRGDATDGEGVLTAAYERDSASGEHGVTYTDTAGGRLRVVLDRFERPIEQDTSLAFVDSVTRTTYDQLGHVVAVSEPRAAADAMGPETRRFFDGLGRLRRVEAPDAVTTHMWFQPRHQFHRQDGGETYETVFDTRGLVSAEIEPGAGGAGTSYTYCASGRLRRITGLGSNNTTEILYDTLGRRTMLDDPSTGHSTFQYDAWDQITRMTNGADDIVVNVHDMLGRVTDRQETHADGSSRHSQWRWDTALDGRGRAVLGALDFSTITTSAAGLDVRDSYAYDDHARPAGMTRTVAGLTLQLATERDALGRLRSVTYPSAVGDVPYAIDLGYDAVSGEVLEVSHAGDPIWQLLDEDARGAPLHEQLGTAIVRDTAYTDAGRVQSLVSNAPENPLQRLSYGYSGRGLLTTRIDDLVHRTDTIEHDALGRIQNVTTVEGVNTSSEGFKIDALGNVMVAGTDRIHFDDPAHPLHATSYEGASLTETLGYDGAGRVTLAGDRTYRWNADDLPRQIVDPSVGTLDFAYSADGERAAKTGPDTTVYLGGIYEVAVHGMGVVERLHVPTPAGVVATIERTGNDGGTNDVTRWLLTDRQGSVETTWIEGEAPEHVRYDPYGGVQDATGAVTGGNPTADVTMGYTAHEHDGELGLVNMNGRIYDPRLRRFLTGDPLAVPGAQGLNRYSYVRNHPFDMTDPSGWQEVPCDWAATEGGRAWHGAIGEEERGQALELFGPESENDGCAEERAGGDAGDSTGRQAVDQEIAGPSRGEGGALADSSLEQVAQDMDATAHTERDVRGFLLEAARGYFGMPIQHTPFTPTTGVQRAGHAVGAVIGLAQDLATFAGGLGEILGGGLGAVLGAPETLGMSIPVGGAVAVGGFVVAAGSVVEAGVHADALAGALSATSAAMIRFDFNSGHALEHVRRHAQDARMTATRLGRPRPDSLADVMRFLEDVVALGEHRVGSFGVLTDMHFYRLGDAIVMTRADGRYVSNFDFARGNSPAIRWLQATPVPR